MTTAPDPAPHPTQPALRIERPAPGLLLVRLSGAWLLPNRPPGSAEIEAALTQEGRCAQEGPVHQIAFDSAAVTAWDTALPVFLWAVQQAAARRGAALDGTGLPDGVRRLLILAGSVPAPERQGPGPADGPFARIGKRALARWDQVVAFLGFLGEVVVAFGALVRGRARYRRTDLTLLLQSVGPQALPIVTLISFLVGVILAFVGAVQLASFGAQIFIADLVGLAMAREMGALMAAIIMAGRTGAAFAAQLGTMQINQEIDALRSLGVSPIEMLVLPRVLALILMMPLLTLYAILIGIFGGMAISIGLFEITFVQHWSQTWGALTLSQFLIGLVKSLVFGALIAISGCYQGIWAGGGAGPVGAAAPAVGAAATSAVVAAIVAIVVADGLFAVMLNALGL